MKGYFAQLARHTGLNIARNSALAVGKSGAPAITPMEVEEVTFTTAPPATEPASRATETLSSATEPASSVTETVSSALDLNVPSASPLSVVPQISFAGSEPQHPGPEVVSPTPQLLTEQAYSLEQRVESIPEQHRVEVIPDQPGPQKLELPSLKNDAHPPEQERTRKLHAQIKEVMAWLATPNEVTAPNEVAVPTEIATLAELEEESPPTFEPMLEAQQQPRNVLVPKREQQRFPEPPHTSASTPEVQDLSLSIGTISVVIEEPKKDFQPSFTPPPANRSPEPITPEPTRLSRYYLRNW